MNGERGALGFACAWDPVPQTTWSHTPWNLRAALRGLTRVVDVGVTVSRAERAALKLLHARRAGGTTVSSWKHSSTWDALCRRRIVRAARSAGVNAVVEIQDLAILDDIPFFVYQDASYDVLLHTWERGARRPIHFPMLNRAAIERRRERQHRVYARAAGVLAMSAWFARTLVEWSDVPAARVHVVHPGINASVPDIPIPDRTTGPRRRLLFVGKDFETKGGPLVVRAVERLRRDDEPGLTLTVAGPQTWPLPSPVPSWVNFVGRVPAARVAGLWDEHDLLVLPSRFDAFGIVFAEALARGLPCIARDAYAMPEMVVPGRNGALVRSGDAGDPTAVDELARAIRGVLADDGIYAAARREAPRVAAHFSWDRAAGEVLRAVQGVPGALRRDDGGTTG